MSDCKLISNWQKWSQLADW